MENKYYVYELIDPDSKLPFYVGKGKNNRMFSHECHVNNGNIPNNNKHLYNKIQKILLSNNEIIYHKTYENLNEKDAFKKEIDRINEIGIENLCNLTEGGNGGTPTTEIRNKISNANKDRIVTEKTKQKIRLSLKNKYKNMTLDERKNRFGNNKNKIPWNYSKKYSNRSKSDEINEKFGNKICLLFKDNYSFSHIARIISLDGYKISYQIVKTVLKMNCLYSGYVTKKLGNRK